MVIHISHYLTSTHLISYRASESLYRTKCSTPIFVTKTTSKLGKPQNGVKRNQFMTLLWLPNFSRNCVCPSLPKPLSSFNINVSWHFICMYLFLFHSMIPQIIEHTLSRFKLYKLQTQHYWVIYLLFSMITVDIISKNQ